MTLKIARAIILLLVLLFSFNTAYASSKVVHKKHAKVVKKHKAKKNKKQKGYPREVIRLANKLEKDKKKLGLKYKNKTDLLDTLNKIWIHTRHDKNFNFYKVVSIAIIESKLDSKALNRRDGGKGLTMAMPKYWRKELPWYRNPYDKNQAIKACVAVLNKNKDMYNCSNWEAVRRYNGAGPKTYTYVSKVKRVYNKISDT